MTVTTTGDAENTVSLTSMGSHARNPSSVMQIADWAAELAAAKQLGDALSKSQFLPESMLKINKDKWKTPEQVAADAAITILAGKSLGLDPLASVQNIFTVRGRPAMYARAMVGIAMGQGHEIERTEATPESVTVRARRRGQREWHTFVWDMGRANKAGYTGNALYKSDPIAMLTAKAQAEACRTLFADVLMGMPQSAEDLQLEDLGEVADEPKTTVKRKPRSKVKSETSKPTVKESHESAESEGPGAPESAGDEDPAEDQQSALIDQQTWDEIKALLQEKEPTAKPGPWGMKAVGRTVTRWGQFTQAEGDRMIALLINGEVSEDQEGDAA